MDLTVNTSQNGSSQLDKSSKADRLDSIVGDVLARQCKGSGENQPDSDPTMSHHHDPSDDIAPTEADIPLHEWVAALTHPTLGPYPNGVTPRILDRLAAEAGVARFPDYSRRRWHKMWSSSNHLCVYLSDEVKSGRLRRVRFGHYAGCFDNRTAYPQGTCSSTGTEPGTNGGDRCCVEASQENANTDTPKEEVGECCGSMDASSTAARSFPVMALASPSTRDRTSSFASQNGSRRRTYRAAETNGDDVDEPQESLIRNTGVSHKALQSRRQRTKFRRLSVQLDEFGLPSLLEDPSFSSVVISMGMDVQSWSVEQSAAFVQDFGFRDAAEAFIREEIDGTALMLLRRGDVLDGLHLKIGPAVKLYRYIRALQKLVCRKNAGQNESSNGDG